MEHFIAQTRQADDDHLIFNLASLSFMDSRGVRLLLHTQAAAQRHGGQVHLAALHAAPARILRITEADQAFACHTSLADATLHAADAAILAAAATLNAPWSSDPA